MYKSISRIIILIFSLLLISCADAQSFSESTPEQVAEIRNEPLQEVVRADPIVEEPVVAEPIRIAAIMPSAHDDLAWSQSMYDALIKIQIERGGVEAIEVVYNEGMFNVDDAAEQLRIYAEDGFDLIIAHGTQYGDALFELAPQYPTTAFAYGTSRDVGREAGIPNIFAYDAQAHEGGFVNGTIAAKLSESGVVGVIGPVETGDAKLYIDGFINGALAVNPTIDVQVVYTGSFGDTELAAETARMLIDAGADVLTGSAQQVVGAIGVAVENDIPWIGTQQDQTSVGGDVVVSTQQYDWAVMIRSMLDLMDEKVYGGTVYELRLDNGGLVMQYANLDQSIVESAEYVENAISVSLVDPTDRETSAKLLESALRSDQ